MSAPLTAVVITVSDRAHTNVYEDRSGPVAAELLAGSGAEVIETRIIPDEANEIVAAIEHALLIGARVILTTGGTGVAPRDVTVEATRPLLSAELPGVAEEIRRRGMLSTPLALLSRGVVGVIRRDGEPDAVVINAPGSRGGVRDTIAVVGGLLRHLVDQLDGVDHEAPSAQP